MKGRILCAAGAWFFSILTIIAGIYLIATGANAGIAVIPMVFALIFHGINRENKKKNN